jgi:hypothetical protein
MRISSDGKITCASKSARETGKPPSAQNGTAMAGIPPLFGYSLKIEMIGRINAKKSTYLLPSTQKC